MQKQCKKCGRLFEDNQTATQEYCPSCKTANASAIYCIADQTLYTVDRVEEDTVVCQDPNGAMYYFDRSLFPVTVRDGEIYRKQIMQVFVKDETATDEAERSAQHQLTNLFEK